MDGGSLVEFYLVMIGLNFNIVQKCIFLKASRQKFVYIYARRSSSFFIFVAV